MENGQLQHLVYSLKNSMPGDKFVNYPALKDGACKALPHSASETKQLH